MRRLFRPLVCAVLLTAACLAVLSWCDSRANGFAGVARDYLHECQRGEALDRRNARALDSAENKQRIASEVIAGRLTLREAVEEFRRLNEGLRDGYDDLIGSYQMPDEDETLGRCVINWVKCSLDGDRRQRRAVVARLKAELKGLRHRPDAI